MQMATAYSVFANGGYRVAPYLIARITDASGNVLSEASPVVAGDKAERAIDPRNAFIMTTLLRDVIAYGTATRAQELEAHATSPARPERPTKTSTPGSAASTQSLVGVAWIGFDQPQDARHATKPGGVAALPIWISLHATRAEGRAGKAA